MFIEPYAIICLELVSRGLELSSDRLGIPNAIENRLKFINHFLFLFWPFIWRPNKRQHLV